MVSSDLAFDDDESWL